MTTHEEEKRLWNCLNSMDGMRRLKRNLMQTYEALTYKTDEILPIEKVQRDKLKYRKKR